MKQISSTTTGRARRFLLCFTLLFACLTLTTAGQVLSLSSAVVATSNHTEHQHTDESSLADMCSHGITPPKRAQNCQALENKTPIYITDITTNRGHTATNYHSNTGATSSDEEEEESTVFDAPDFTLYRLNSTDYFAEDVDPASGTLGVSHNDLAIPGTAGLNLNITRRYITPSNTQKLENNANPDFYPFFYDGGYISQHHRMGYGWDIDFGHIYSANWTKVIPDISRETRYPKVPAGQERFTSCYFKTATSGTHIENPKLFHANGNAEFIYNSKASEQHYALVTASGFRGGCMNDRNGYQFYAKDGTQYTYDVIKYKLIGEIKANQPEPLFYGYYLSTIKDKYGNWIRVHYVDNDLNGQPGQALIANVTTSDGRQVDFHYSNTKAKRLVSVSYHDKTLFYDYDNAGNLSTVRNGNTILWQYRYVYPYPYQPSRPLLHSITTETGGIITYEYNTDVGRNASLDVPTTRQRLLTQRHTSGTLPTATTHYFYADGRFWANFPAGSEHLNPIAFDDGLPFTSFDYNPSHFTDKFFETLIINDNRCERHFFHNGTQGHWLSGKLAFKAIYQTARHFGHYQSTASSNAYQVVTGGSNYCQQLLRTEHHVYDDSIVLSSQTHSTTYTHEGDTVAYRVTDAHIKLARPKHVIITEGRHRYTTEYSDYTPFGQARQTRAFNTAHEQQKHIRSTFENTPFNAPLEPLQSQAIADQNNLYTTVLSRTFSPLYDVATQQRFGSRKTYAYYDNGNLQRVTWNVPKAFGTGNRTVEYQDYSLGLARSIIRPQRYGAESVTTKRSIDAHGRITMQQDFNGHQRHYQYNRLDRLTHINIVDAAFADTTIDYQYVSDGQLQQAVTKGDYRETILFDGFLNPVQSSKWDHLAPDATRTVTTKTYDDEHRLVFASLPSDTDNHDIGIHYQYDALNRQTRRQLPGNIVTTQDYIDGHIIRASDGKQHNTTTHYLAYGAPAFTQATRIMSPENVLTDIGVNLFGNVTHIQQGSQTGARTHTEYRVYNDHQHLCKIIRSDVGTTVYQRNHLGEIQWMAQGVNDANINRCHATLSTNDRIHYQYDNQGALHQTLFPDNTPDVTNTLDANGNLIQLDSADVSHTYQYNSQNLLTSETLQFANKQLQLTYRYTPLGHVQSLTYPDSDTVSFAPNALGQPTQALRQRQHTPDYPYASGALYYPSGNINTFTYGNNLVHKTTQNTQQLPSRISDGTGAISALDYSYAYDKNSNVAAITDNLNSQFSLLNLSYDGLDRLTAVTGNSAIGNSALSYDELGNITTYQSKNSLLHYTYNYTVNSSVYGDSSSNRLRHVSGAGSAAKHYVSFAYDNRGNIINNSYNHFHYNLANQLTTAETANNTYSYLYDGHNRRVKQTDATGTSYSMYSFDGTLLYRETDADHTNYIYLGKKLIAKDGFTQPSSTKQHYRPFGSSIEGETNDIGYTGHKFDTALGLSYMQARYYDPVIGRFYSNDPVDTLGHIDRGNPIHGFNRYAYANNNPYKYVDPDGEFGVAGAIYGAIAGGVGGFIASGNGIKSKVVGTISGAGAGGAVGFFAPQTSHVAGLAAAGAVASATGQAVGSTLSAAIDKGAENVTINDVKVDAATTVAGGLGAGAGAIVAKGVANMTARPIVGQTLSQAGTPTTTGTAAGAVAEGAIIGTAEKAAPKIEEIIEQGS